MAEKLDWRGLIVLSLFVEGCSCVAPHFVVFSECLLLSVFVIAGTVPDIIIILIILNRCAFKDQLFRLFK
jgi:hypothetical protein